MATINPLDQDRTFCFFLITHASIGSYFFSWNQPHHKLQMRILNTVCGWTFVRDWKDNEYDFSIGKAIRMDAKVKNEVNLLWKEFMSESNNEHKSLISSFFKTMSSVKDEELFFIYRIVYTFPTQRLLYKILNELSFIKKGKCKEEADTWFNNNAATFFSEYDVIYYGHAKVGERERAKRVCRFCGRKMPETSFKDDAHAVPESIGGHKNLICYEECDECNKSFGAGIEQNLFQWFDFRRSTQQVKKKSGGVPKAYGCNYVVEDNKVSIFLNMQNENEIKLVGSGTVTLQGIYRALCKIAIDLIEGEFLERLKTTIDWVRFGHPKSSHYPQIAQMYSLPEVKEPMIYICTRKDRCDTDNAPLHFCILRIFDLAFLYVLPHIDSRMNFYENYTKCIPTEALKVIGFYGDWVWDSYDTTEERNPHVWINFSNAKIIALDRNGKAPIEKLRIERKPKDSIDFTTPKITVADILKRNLESVNFTNTNNIKCVTGRGSIQTIVDLHRRIPLFMKLNVVYEDMRSVEKLATIVYSVQVSPNVLYQQIYLYDDDSFSLNQDLFVHILKITLESLYKDILVRYADFPYTREMLYINNVRELLNDMQLILMKEGQMIGNVQGKEIWHTGY